MGKLLRALSTTGLVQKSLAWKGWILFYTYVITTCTASVILYWCSVFISTMKIHRVPLRNSRKPTEPFLVKLGHLWTGESTIIGSRKATSFKGFANLQDMCYRLWISYAETDFLVFLLFLSFAHDRCWPLYLNSEPSWRRLRPTPTPLPPAPRRGGGCLHIAARSKVIGRYSKYRRKIL